MANSDERAGQPESMEQVIALYYDQIYKFCYWKTHSAVDAQDITQDTFIRFMDAAQTYSDIESPSISAISPTFKSCPYRKSKTSCCSSGSAAMAVDK